MYLFILFLGLLKILDKKMFLFTLTLCAILFYTYTTMTKLSFLKPLIDIFNLIGLQGFLTMSSSYIIIMFLIGALYYIYGDRIIFNSKVSLVLFIILVLSFRTEYFYLTSFLSLPYLVLWIGLKQTEQINNFIKYGDFSYGLYIYAFPVQQLVMHYLRGINLLELFIISVPFSTICAILSWNFIESRALEFKKVSPTQIFNVKEDKLLTKINMFVKHLTMYHNKRFSGKTK
jgi:peptidoglycan/LPS O-acetylase OafA/YrhL